MLRRKHVWIGFGLVLVLATLVISSIGLQRAYANVTLLSFTASTLATGQPEISINWETGSELNTAGFYLQRSLTNTASSFARVSPYQPANGDPTSGKLYNWTDEDPALTLNTTYWYRLEEVTTSQVTKTYDSNVVMVIAGAAPTSTPTNTPVGAATATNTFTPSPTRTPTATSKPATGTATSTSTATPRANPAATSVTPLPSATPRRVEGATITPRATSDSVLPPPTTSDLTAQNFATPQPAEPPLTTSAQDSPPATAAPESRPAPVAAAPTSEVYTAQGPAPSQVKPDAGEPVVVVTEPAATTGQTTPPRGGALPLFMGAAALLLVGAYLILRQARK